ncbi:Kinase, ULK [Giardia muris]|uniref:Kinase, ULK n=1 Tax=Giardia muris TaxID=5742 RepID=A0A4Z1TBN8_GIAMU|nr:Kinase, ULK [Giardia muris]|eukprot:TNJ29939.1 Kinase, ULK [Giardia muris]
MNTAAKFKTYEEIGRGKFTGSVIYRARQSQSLEYVAAKHTDVSIPSVKTKVQTEASFLNSCVHPNILKFITWYQTQDEIWLITELCEGGSFESLLNREHHHWPEVSIELFAHDIRDALHFLHMKGVLFNELTPANLFLDINGNLKLSDFEFATQISKLPTLTLETIDRSVKTNGYLHKAPETLLPDGCNNISADLYSFGCLLYKIIFRKYPFEVYMEKLISANFVDSGSESDFDDQGQGPRITVRTRDYQKYAMRVIREGEDYLSSSLIPASYRGFPLSPQLKDLLFRLLQPLPFKRLTWVELASHPFFTGKIKERIKCPLEAHFINAMRLFTTNGVYPELYQAVSIQSDGRITCPKNLCGNLTRFEERLRDERKIPAASAAVGDAEPTAVPESPAPIAPTSPEPHVIMTVSLKNTGLFYMRYVMQDPTISQLFRASTLTPFEATHTFQSFVTTTHQMLTRTTRYFVLSRFMLPLLLIVKTDFDKATLSSIGSLEKFLYQGSRTGLKLAEYALSSHDLSVLTTASGTFHTFLVQVFLSAANSHLGDTYFDSRVGYGLMNRKSDLDRAAATLALFYYNLMYNPSFSAMQTTGGAALGTNERIDSELNRVWFEELGNLQDPSAPLMTLITALLTKPTSRSKPLYTTSVTTTALMLQILLVLLRLNLVNAGVGDMAKMLYNIDLHSLLANDILPYIESVVKPVPLNERHMPKEKVLLHALQLRVVFATFMESMALLLENYYVCANNILPGLPHSPTKPYTEVPSGVLRSIDFNYFKLDVIQKAVPFSKCVNLLATMYSVMAVDKYGVTIRALCGTNAIALHAESVRLTISALSAAIIPDMLPLLMGNLKTLLDSLDFTIVSQNFEYLSQILGAFITLTFGELLTDYFNVLGLSNAQAMHAEPPKEKEEGGEMPWADASIERYREWQRHEQSKPYSYLRGVKKMYDTHTSKSRELKGITALHAQYKLLLSVAINEDAMQLKPYVCMAFSLLFFFDFNTFDAYKNTLNATGHPLYRVITDTEVQDTKLDFLKLLQNMISDCSRIMNDNQSLKKDYVDLVRSLEEAEGGRQNGIEKLYFKRVPGQTVRGLQAMVAAAKTTGATIQGFDPIEDFTQATFEASLEQYRLVFKLARSRDKREVAFRGLYLDSFTALSSAILTYLDVCAQIVKNTILQTSNINIKTYFRGLPALQVIDGFFQSYTRPHVPFYLFRRLTLNIESCLFGFANTIYSVIPPRELYEAAILNDLSMKKEKEKKEKEDQKAGVSTDTKTIKIEGIDEALQQQQEASADKKGTPAFFALSKEFVTMSRLLLGIAACLINHPAHHLVRDHLFYISDATRKVKGLIFATMNLLKDLQNFSLFEPFSLTDQDLLKAHGKDDLMSFNYAIELFRYIRNAAANLIAIGLERGRMYGPFNSYSSVEVLIKSSGAIMTRIIPKKKEERVIQQSDTFVDLDKAKTKAEPELLRMVRDIQEVGLFMDEVISVTELTHFTEAIIGSYHRLLNSQSMLLCLFNVPEFHDVALTIVVNALRTRKINLNSELRKYFLQSYIHGRNLSDRIVEGTGLALTDERVWQLFVANSGCQYTLGTLFPTVLIQNTTDLMLEGDHLYAFIRVLNILHNSTCCLMSVFNAHIQALTSQVTKLNDSFFSLHKKVALRDHLSLLTDESFTSCNLLSFVCEIFKQYVVLGGSVHGVLPEAYLTDQFNKELEQKREGRQLPIRPELLTLALDTFELYTNLAMIYAWSEYTASLYFKGVFSIIVFDLQKWFAEKAETLSAASLRDDLLIAYIDLTDSLLFYNNEFCNAMDVYQSVGQLGKTLSRVVRVKLESLKSSFGNPYARNLPPKQWYDGVLDEGALA